MEQKDNLQGLIDAVQNAFLQMGVNAGPETIQSIAATIYQAMSADGRYYHTPQHALALVEEDDPILTLAALFHDVVYFQVDQGFSPEIQQYIDPLTMVLPTGEPGFQIAEDDASDLSLLMLREVFGFDNQPRAFAANGSNEFLSSLVMAKKLEHLVKLRVLIQIAACIEATIPFRGTEKNGIGPFDQLAQRLRRFAKMLGISGSNVELDEAIWRAVRLANQDVGNFSLHDPAAFLEGTWKLLPESYLALRRGSEYTLAEYRNALEGMEKFIRSIDADNVLHRYTNFPPEEITRKKSGNVRRNLAVSEAYLEIKLLTIAFFEALAFVSGGDAPISTFLGPVDRIAEGNQREIRNLALAGVVAEDIDPTSEMYRLVERGVRGVVDYTDVNSAPIALFIYRYLGSHKVRVDLAAAREMFAGKINPDAFLCRVDARVVVKVAEVIAQNSPGRGETLLRYLGERVRFKG